MLKDLLPGIWLDMREDELLHIGIHALDLLDARSSEDFNDFKQLVAVRISWENRLSQKEFSKDTPYWKNV